MTDRHPQWSHMPFKGQYLGMFKLPGGTWRYLRSKGEKRTFATAGEAEAAARQRALDILFPAMRATAQPSDSDIAEKLGVSEWLRSKRADIKKTEVVRAAGRRPLVVVPGRA